MDTEDNATVSSVCCSICDHTNDDVVGRTHMFDHGDKQLCVNCVLDDIFCPSKRLTFRHGKLGININERCCSICTEYRRMAMKFFLSRSSRVDVLSKAYQLSQQMVYSPHADCKMLRGRYGKCLICFEKRYEVGNDGNVAFTERNCLQYHWDILPPDLLEILRLAVEITMESDPDLNNLTMVLRDNFNGRIFKYDLAPLLRAAYHTLNAGLQTNINDQPHVEQGEDTVDGEVSPAL